MTTKIHLKAAPTRRPLALPVATATTFLLFVVAWHALQTHASVRLEAASAARAGGAATSKQGEADPEELATRLAHGSESETRQAETAPADVLDAPTPDGPSPPTPTRSPPAEPDARAPARNADAVAAEAAEPAPPAAAQAAAEPAPPAARQPEVSRQPDPTQPTPTPVAPETPVVAQPHPQGSAEGEAPAADAAPDGPVFEVMRAEEESVFLALTNVEGAADAFDEVRCVIESAPPGVVWVNAAGVATPAGLHTRQPYAGEFAITAGQRAHEAMARWVRDRSEGEPFSCVQPLPRSLDRAVRRQARLAPAGSSWVGAVRSEGDELTIDWHPRSQ